MHSVYESGTGACTEHTHQVLMRAQRAFPSKKAEHTHQELMRMLSMRISSLRACSVYASVPYAYAQCIFKEFKEFWPNQIFFYGAFKTIS